MKFQSRASIHAANGERVGHLKSVVVDPSSQEVNGLVAERGFLFTEEKVIPLNWVAHTEQDGTIVLYEGKNDFDNLPKYEEKMYVPMDARYADETRTMSEAEAAGTVSPAVYFTGAPGFYPGNYAYGLGGVAPIIDPPNYVSETVENIPDGTLALRIGTPVFTINDEQIGSIDQVFTDSHGSITHLVISKGLLFTIRKLVPTGWISRVGETGVVLNVTGDVLNNLPDYDTYYQREQAR